MIITYSECVFVVLVISMQSACTVLYCHLLPVQLHHIFPQYLINGTISRKKNTQNALGYSLQILSESF
jgi:hypothetical protein